MEITFSMLAQTVIAALLVSGKISFHCLAQTGVLGQGEIMYMCDSVCDFLD